MKLNNDFQITPIDFFKEIEDLTKRHDFNYIDAVVHWAEKHEANIEDLTPLINKNLKNKLQLDYESLHYLPKSSKLPL